MRLGRWILIIAGLLVGGLVFSRLGLAQDSQGKTYIIGPSDVLEVLVWREPNISRADVVVRPDGKISLPLLDDVQAAGLTPMELKRRITAKLAEYIEAPQVYIMVRKPASHFFCVLGNVTRPGQYPMLRPTTVLQALAAARGFNEWAHKDEIIIVRGYGESQRVFRFNYSEVVSGEAMDQNILLEPGDVIVVP